MWSCGDKYVGSWYKNMFHGEGTLFYADKMKYTGEYAKHLQHGYGTLEWPDGSSYVGEWKKGA